MPGSLSGVRIVDFTQLVQGPFATQILGDLGADIVKIEKPGGDWLRAFAFHEEYLGGESPSFLAFNRNKRSITLNLKNERGCAVARELAAKSDVLIENFRPGVMEKLGLGYEDLSQSNSRLIYCSSTGYGPSGPYAKRPGQDLLIQAMSGITYMNGRKEDPPTPVGIGVADQVAGFHIVYTVLSALYYRERTGQGQKLDVNLLNSFIALQQQEFVTAANTQRGFERSNSGIGHPGTGAPFGIYETKDSYIAIAMTPIPKLGRLMGASDLEVYDTPQKAWDHRDEIKRRLDEIFPKKTTQEWLDRLDTEDIWCAPVLNYTEAINHPQVIANDLMTRIQHPTAGEVIMPSIPVSFSLTPGEIRMSPPLVGEHTEDVLDELGYSATQIKELRDVGAV